MTDRPRVTRPSGSVAVMAQRREPPDSLDFFPTPPWATRALFKHVLMPRRLWHPQDRVWEPACGEGHMSAVLQEFGATVIATDVFDYSGGDPARWPAGWSHVQDFLDELAEAPVADWIVTNPPFKVADQFALRALMLALKGSALLVRTSWLEGGSRFRDVFEPYPPAIIAQFAERVPMVKGRWDPSADTATSYCWVVWLRGVKQPTAFVWIPPGQREALTLDKDIRRFCRLAPMPLFGDDI